jgi:exodeoxyribonuclease I
VADSFYFYDLETSGFNARTARIMQFAGQRTDMDLKPIGEPDNILIKMTDDVLPEPEAILVTGITPQATRAGGISEAEFAKYLTSQVFIPGTISVGYNNIRFDNEFIRFMLWRNFYDAYEWQWKENCSSWDLLDLVRMTRALRPDGIKWPYASDGKPSNRLELLASVNKLKHASAHDALSDVGAAVSLAGLVKKKQPKLFDYLLNLRGKAKVAALVTKGDPVIYTSGRYPSEWEKTTIAVMVAPHPERNAALMYDLRIDPDQFKDLSPRQLAERWQARGEDAPYFPVKVLAYNRCPALAGDLRVLDKAAQKRLGLHMEIIGNHLQKLRKLEDLGDKLVRAQELMKKPAKIEMVIDEQKVDELLYEGFIPATDKAKMSMIRAASPEQLSELNPDFADERLNKLLPLYKARNFPSSLVPQEQEWWEKYRMQRLLDGGEKSRAAVYFKRLEELGAQPGMSPEGKYLLEELKLYGESVIPDY